MMCNICHKDSVPRIVSIKTDGNYDRYNVWWKCVNCEWLHYSYSFFKESSASPFDAHINSETNYLTHITYLWAKGNL